MDRWFAVTALAALALAGCEQAPQQEASAAVILPRTQPQQASRSDDELRDRIDAVLHYTLHGRELRLDTHAAWQIMHGVAAYGPLFPVVNGDERVRALDWLFSGHPVKGWTLRAGLDGVETVIEPRRTGQGHPDQWLGYLALWHVPSSTALLVDGQTYSLADLVRQAMRNVDEGQELTWTLLALSEYADPTDEWLARDHSSWTLERIVAVEAAVDLSDVEAHDEIGAAACGGTHRVSALALALQRYQARMPGVPLQGAWAVAQERIQWAVAQAALNQLPSGGLSVDYFVGPADSSDPIDHLRAGGHTLEFLSLALDDDALLQPWVADAAKFLCGVFEQTKSIDLECGAVYHAAHGLSLYRHRRFGPKDYFEGS